MQASGREWEAQRAPAPATWLPAGVAGCAVGVGASRHRWRHSPQESSPTHPPTSASSVQAAGVEHALEVAHAVFDGFERQGACRCCWPAPRAGVGGVAGAQGLELEPHAARTYAASPSQHHAHPPAHLCLALPTHSPTRPPPGLYIDVEHGSALLALAARRATADLAFAHRVYDAMAATKRWVGGWGRRGREEGLSACTRMGQEGWQGSRAAECEACCSQHSAGTSGLRPAHSSECLGAALAA